MGKGQNVLKNRTDYMEYRGVGKFFVGKKGKHFFRRAQQAALYLF